MTHSQPPFTVIPWDRDFFPVLRDRVLDATGMRPEQALIIFPHDRPRRYVQESFAAAQKALFLPRMLTVRELFAALRPSGRPLREAGLIDRVALLYECCRDVSRKDDPLGTRLVRGGAAAFFPWGERLDALLEECLSQNITPTDLHHAETEVAPFGADLLAALGRIFSRYVTMLPERGRTTPGLDAYWAVRTLDQDLPPLFRHKTIFLAGFHVLTGTEERLFRFLWSQGAHILLHSDPALAEDRAPHWSCEGHARWIRKWSAQTVAACPSLNKPPAVRFFSGHDLHSQLAQLATDLTEDLLADQGEERRSPSRAVALTHPELLLPVLHHLPEKRCNVSLGYPLERTTLHRLLECILRLAEQCTEDGRVPWRDFSELACHPWLRLLRSTSPDGEESGPEFTRLLHILDTHIRNGGRLQTPHAAAEQAVVRLRQIRDAEGRPPGGEAPPQALLDQVLHHTLFSWRRAATLADMADCLSGLAELLATAGQEVWKRFPLDGECLVRLAQNIIPPLRDNDMAEEPLPMELRHEMVRTLLRAERVPFEADPITGLQVLGMLETRLLHFARVYVLDATDNALPGSTGHDPLLPDSLRGVIGLPDIQHRDLLAAHTFHRLLAGAEEVCLYWQEGGQPSGIMDTVSQRSRLVEELLWQEEQRRGTLLKPGQEPLRTASIHLRPPRRAPRALARSPVMQARIASLLQTGVSATGLDEYLSCPLKFYYSRVVRLAGRQEVPEGDEPVAVGELLHTLLQELYTPFVGQLCRKEAIDLDRMEALFARHLAQSPLSASLPPESLIMFALSGPERLRRFLHSQPDSTRILELERDFSTPLSLCGERFTLRGRLDRVDERENGVWILDYKTGRMKSIAESLWHDDVLWHDLQLWLHEAHPAAMNEETNARGNALLLKLSTYCQSVQLPCYIAVYAAEHPEVKTLNAAYVNLADKGEEAPIFGPKLHAELREAAQNERIPQLLAFLLRHMRVSMNFTAQNGSHCDWCSFKNLCMLP